MALPRWSRALHQKPLLFPYCPLKSMGLLAFQPMAPHHGRNLLRHLLVLQRCQRTPLNCPQMLLRYPLVQAQAVDCQ